MLLKMFPRRRLLYRSIQPAWAYPPVDEVTFTGVDVMVKAGDVVAGIVF